MEFASIVTPMLCLSFFPLIEATSLAQDHRTKHDCRLPTNHFAVNDFQPLVLHTVSRYPRFQYPSLESSVEFVRVTGETRLVCANGSIAIDSRVPPDDLQSVSIQCGVTGYQLTQEDLVTQGCHHCRPKSKPRCVTSANTFGEIGCTTRQLPEAYPSCNRPKHCRSKVCKTCIEIGYQLNGRFLPTIEFIRVDESNLQPLMAHVNIPPVIGNKQMGRSAWMMRKGPIFRSVGLSIEDVYRRDYQRRRFYEIFKNRQMVDFYIPENGDAYLTEGQLISENDFFYKSQQSSAFFYENTIPIWRTVDKGNWELVGEFVRKLAAKTRAGLDVWSGTIGHLTLPDLSGDEKPIFLIEGVHGEHLVPVPQLLYKYVVDYHGPHGPRGLMLVTVNDPRGPQFLDNKTHLICTPKQICQKLQPEFADARRGYTYCCSLDEVCSRAEKLGLPAFTSEVEMLL